MGLSQSGTHAGKEESTCPKCGEEKETYEKYCSSCKRKIEDEKEDKEEHTCKKCGKYDSFMFSMDDECSDCKRKREEEEDNESRKKVKMNNHL